MAPLKPLVAQQAKACQEYVPILSEHIAELTGKVPPPKRKQLWESKRVFFLTPQILQNDLQTGVCDASNIVCMVMDEAHHAQGNYAYCKVVTQVEQKTKHFRILALTATPGSDKRAIQQVIDNLRISKMEVRTEQSIDVMKYVHQRKVDVVKVSLGEEIEDLKELFISVVEEYVQWLHSQKVLFQDNARKISSYTLTKAKKKYEATHNTGNSLTSTISAKFNILIGLYHSYQQLTTHGIATFAKGIKKFYDKAGESKSVIRRRVATSPDFARLLSAIQKYSSVDNGNELDIQRKMHPKFRKLEEIVSEHFINGSNGTTIIDSRIMIFCQFRETVNEIVKLLDHLTAVRATAFLGQSGAKGNKGMSQKEQQAVLDKFKSGFYNTLVCTCIGEEGLDIGEVDLIICFDTQNSPTRTVQRMGRTGRKGDGRCVILVSEGTEATSYTNSKSKKKRVFNDLENNLTNFQYTTNVESRIVPSTVATIPTFTNSNYDFSKIDTEDDSDDMELDLNNVDISDLPSKKKETIEQLKAPTTTKIKDSPKRTKQLELKMDALSLLEPTDTSTHMFAHSKRCKLFIDVLSLYPPPKPCPEDKGDIDTLTKKSIHEDQIFIESDDDDFIDLLSDATSNLSKRISKLEEEQEDEIIEDIKEDIPKVIIEPIDEFDMKSIETEPIKLLNSNSNNIIPQKRSILKEEEETIPEPYLKKQKISPTKEIPTKQSSVPSAFSKWSYNNTSTKDNSLPKPDLISEALNKDIENSSSVFSPSPSKDNEPPKLEFSPIQQNWSSKFQQDIVSEDEIEIDIEMDEKKKELSNEFDDPFDELFPSPAVPVWANNQGEFSFDSSCSSLKGEDDCFIIKPPSNNSPKLEKKSIISISDDDDVVMSTDSSSDFEDSSIFKVSPKKPLMRLKKVDDKNIAQPTKKVDLAINSKIICPKLPKPNLSSIQKTKPPAISRIMKKKTRVSLSPNTVKYFLDNEACCKSDSEDDEEEDSGNLSFIVSQVSPEKDSVNMRAIYHFSLLSESSQRQAKKMYKSRKTGKEHSPISPQWEIPRTSRYQDNSPTTDWFDGISDEEIDFDEIDECAKEKVEEHPSKNFFLSDSPQGLPRLSQLSSSASM